MPRYLIPLRTLHTRRCGLAQERLPVEESPAPPVTRPDEGDQADKEMEARFRILAKQWREETGMWSMNWRMEIHPAYQEIIAMGESAVPLLLRELQECPDHWFGALRAITGENPVPPELAGKVKPMADSWVRWGRERGYIS